MLRSGFTFVRHQYLTLLLLLCGTLPFISCELGESPLAPRISSPDTSPVSSDSGDNIRIRALPSTVNSDSGETAVIEAAVFDDNHNPIIGKEVLFTATAGIVTAKDTTNASGIAFAVFSPDPNGGDAVVKAKISIGDKSYSSTTTVRSVNQTVRIGNSAKSMHIQALPPSLNPDEEQTATIKVTLADTNHNPVTGQEVVFTATSGLVTAKDTTDGSGIAYATFSPDPAGGDAVVTAKISIDNKSYSVATTVRYVNPAASIDSSDKSMRIRALPSTLNPDKEQSAAIEVTLFDTNHNPVTGREVVFTATSGLVTAKDTTNASGIATAQFTPDPGFSEAVIVANVTFGKKTWSAATTVRSAGTIVSIDSVNKNMRIRANPSALFASFSDNADVSVTVFDGNHNPIVGKEIFFSSTRGIITAKSLTDSNGIALAAFTAEPINANVTITAKMAVGDAFDSVAATVTLSGITIVIIPQLSSAPLGAAVPVKIKLLDGTGLPIPDRQMLVVTGRDSTKTTDGAGEITTTVSRGTTGTVIIRAAALGTSDSASVYFGTSAPIDDDNSIRSLRLFTSAAQLRADNSAEATVTAVIISEDTHNPLIGDTVQFSSTLGIIDHYGITDNTGRTTVTLRSAPVNGSCVIRALLKGNSSIKDSTTVLFSGVTLELSADRNDLRITDTAFVRALLKDGSGNPISSDFVNFSVVAPGVFADGSRFTRSTLDATGIAMVKVSCGTAKKVVLHAASANVADSIILSFTTNNLSVTASKTSLVIGGRDSARISARYLDMGGNPLSGKTITFAANAGTLSALTATTDADGIAVTWLKSGYFSTEATVQAKSPDGSDFITVHYRAATAGAISLAVTPDNIGINGGIAELIATVKDDSGNVVTGAEVSFKILKGPGGGEQIDKPIITSTNDGIARARLLAGSLPGTYRGCEVEAAVNGISAATKLTISGAPNTITISRPEDDTVTVPKGGQMDESTFEFFVGAVVNDVNGNPVADGTPVNFSTVVSGMRVSRLRFERWETKDGDTKPILDYVSIDIPFEDMNGNLKYDPGIDLDLDGIPNSAARGDDRNGDGVVNYNILTNGIFWDFNHNGICDTTPGIFYGEPYFGPLKPSPEGDSLPDFYADLNRNGRWDRWECSPAMRKYLPPVMYTIPYTYDFEFWRWEMRPQFHGQRLDFSNNDFAIVIDRTAVTKGGVASTRLIYPRQLANRLIATVNAEVKGIRDKDGERFTLPIVR